MGRTDEPLLADAVKSLEENIYPQVELVVVSPMLRCIQTGKIIYPDVETWVCQGLQEMDFGEFEYKNYQELDGDPRYQAYIDSGGQLPFPGGEGTEHFKERCIDAFENVMQQICEKKVQSVAFVVHGGTIMSILEAYAKPQRSYFEWQLKNGQWIEGVFGDKGEIYIDR